MDNKSLQERVTELEKIVEGLTRDKTVDNAAIKLLSAKQNKDNFSDTMIFVKKVFFKSMVKLGVSTSKIGFFGAEPAIQQTQITTPSGGGTVDSQARSSIVEIKTALTNLGLTT